MSIDINLDQLTMWKVLLISTDILSLRIHLERIRAERIRTERIRAERILVTKYPILNVSYLERILLETYPLS